MTAKAQRALALEASIVSRQAQAAIRRELRADRSFLDRVLLDPPAELAAIPVVDVVRMSLTTRSSPALTRLGRLAARDAINLMVPLGEASLRTREWAVENAAWHWRHAPGRRILSVVEA